MRKLGRERAPQESLPTTLPRSLDRHLSQGLDGAAEGTRIARRAPSKDDIRRTGADECGGSDAADRAAPPGIGPREKKRARVRRYR
jgi:hypothetical protein